MDCLDAILDPLTPPTDASSHSDPPAPLLPLARVGGGGRRRRGTTPRTREQQARSVARRNARERKRVKLVNLGFAALREHIPPHLGPEPPAAKGSKTAAAAAANNKKLSKVDTLRCAIEYIKQLRDAVGFAEDEGEFSTSYCETPSPDKMTIGDSSSSPAMFGDDENDDFFNIVDWTSL